MSGTFTQALKAVASRWLNTLHWAAILTPPLVAFNDNVASIQVVAGHSMSPALNPNPSSILLDVVLVSKVSEFSKGDIVLLSEPVREERTRIVKRVADITHDQSAVYVLGDNSFHSTDSRQFGYVPSCMVDGVVKSIIFPPWRIRNL